MFQLENSLIVLLTEIYYYTFSDMWNLQDGRPCPMMFIYCIYYITVYQQDTRKHIGAETEAVLIRILWGLLLFRDLDEISLSKQNQMKLKTIFRIIPINTATVTWGPLHGVTWVCFIKFNFQSNIQNIPLCHKPPSGPAVCTHCRGRGWWSGS